MMNLQVYPAVCIFFNSFPLETDFFFTIFEQDPECITESNQMNPSNTVSVATLIEEIQSELNDQTGSWRKVSELLNQADVEFGFGNLIRNMPTQSDKGRSQK